VVEPLYFATSTLNTTRNHEALKAASVGVGSRRLPGSW
ncbi:unnamed protein product, partial [Acidithrix sp. C25]